MQCCHCGPNYYWNSVYHHFHRSLASGLKLSISFWSYHVFVVRVAVAVAVAVIDVAVDVDVDNDVVDVVVVETTTSSSQLVAFHLSVRPRRLGPAPTAAAHLPELLPPQLRGLKERSLSLPRHGYRNEI